MENGKRPVITVTMEKGGQFAFELHPEWAPNACNSVISLAKAGAYDGMTIDRIVPGFVIQPRYLDEGRPDLDYFIDGEFKSNGFEQNPPIVTGTVAMAGDGATFSSGSCFFITMGENPRLSGNFTAIGTVISGWEEVKRLEGVEIVPVDNDMGAVINRPVEPEIMEKVTVETFGEEYPEPVILRRAY